MFILQVHRQIVAVAVGLVILDNCCSEAVAGTFLSIAQFLWETCVTFSLLNEMICFHYHSGQSDM